MLGITSVSQLREEVLCPFVKPVGVHSQACVFLKKMTWWGRGVGGFPGLLEAVWSNHHLDLGRRRH